MFAKDAAKMKKKEARVFEGIIKDHKINVIIANGAFLRQFMIKMRLHENILILILKKNYWKKLLYSLIFI